jgi:hypothetical protein
LSLKKDGAAKTALKAITNIVNVPVKFIGKFLSVGLEKAAPYTNSSNGSIFRFFKTIPNYLKSGFGGFLRFVLYLFVIAPPLAKAATKVSHFIFGKPTYSILDDKEDVDVTPEQVKNTITIQIPNRTFDDENPKFNNSLNKPAFAGKITFENKDIKETELTYVPSSKGVNVIPKDPIKARIAIQNSLETEKFVNKRIKEKFKREY